MTRQSLVRTNSFYVVIKYFYVATALAKVKRIYVTIEFFFFVATKFGLGWGFYVVIEHSYVAIEFDLDRRF